MTTDYTYTFLTLRDEQIIAEIPLYGVYAARKINDPGQMTASFNFDQSGMTNSDLVAATTPGRTWCVMERNGVPVWWGIVWSRTYQSQSKSCQIYAWGFEAYPRKRRIVQDMTWTATPNTQIFCDFWRSIQSAAGGNLNVNIPNYTDGPVKDLTILATDNQYYSQSMDNLSQSDDGFDWTVDLVKNTDGTYTKTLRVGYPSIGSSIGDPDVVVFEYPGSILNYYNTESMSDAGTDVFTTGSGEGSAMPISVTEQTDMITSGWPRWDVDVSFKDVTSQTQINTLALQQKIVRKPPMPTYIITVKGDQDPVFGSYNLGDACQLIITDPRHPSSNSNPGVIASTTIIGFEITPPSADSVEEISITMPDTVSATENVGGNVNDPALGGQTQVSITSLLWGTTIKPYPLTGDTNQMAYDDYVTDCGRPDYVRVSLNSTQSTLANFPTAWPIAGEFNDYSQRGTFLSFKPNLTTFASGSYDAKLTSLVTNYNGRFLDLCVYPMPEADIANATITLANWQAAVAHLVSWKAATPNAKLTIWVVLDGFTFDVTSGRNPNDYLVSGIPAYGVNQYNLASARHDGTVFSTPSTLMDPFTTWANSKPVNKGWIEIGCSSDFSSSATRATWIQQMSDYINSNNYIRASWYDGADTRGDWEVRSSVQRAKYYPTSTNVAGETVLFASKDAPSIAAWRLATGR